MMNFLSKTASNDALYTSKRGRKVMMEDALLRDEVRRKEEAKGRESPPFNPKRDLNITVEEA